MKTSQLFNFLFVMDAVEKIYCPDDTSTSILMELKRRGHRVFYSEPSDLALVNGEVFAKAKTVRVDLKKGYRILAESRISLSEMNAVFIRKDPPVDLEYLYMTYLLDFVPKHVLMINPPKSIRDSNEKLYPFEFKKWMPPSIATSDFSRILDFQENIGEDIILKVINDKGGHGISRLKLKDPKRRSIVKRATQNGSQTILAQQFLKADLTKGDKRILIWDGKVIGVFGRIPKRGEFRANLSLGGKRVNANLTRREKEMVRVLLKDFRKKNFLFVGVDVIDGFLTEINVTSPAGITDLNYLYKTHLERYVVDRLEQKLAR